MDTESRSHVEAFDASYGTAGDHAGEVPTIAEFRKRSASLTHEEREAWSHQLGLGKPRSGGDLGIATDPDTGKPIVPDEIRDDDCDPDLYEKSPDEMVDVLKDRDEFSGGDSIEELMQPNITIVHGGGGNSGKLKREKRRPRGNPFRTIEDEPRDHRVSARVSESTALGLEAIELETGVNVAGLLAAIANLHERGGNSAIYALTTVLKGVPVTSEMRGVRERKESLDKLQAAG